MGRSQRPHQGGVLPERDKTLQVQLGGRVVGTDDQRSRVAARWRGASRPHIVLCSRSGSLRIQPGLRCRRSILFERRGRSADQNSLTLTRALTIPSIKMVLYLVTLLFTHHNRDELKLVR